MFMYTDARPEWAKEADKILPEWPSVLPPPDWDHGNQTDFPVSKCRILLIYDNYICESKLDLFSTNCTEKICSKLMQSCNSNTIKYNDFNS